MTILALGRSKVRQPQSVPAQGTATTVIVPTRNERDNIAELLRRLVPGLPPDSEIIFVDDSDDDTVAIIEAESVGLPVSVRVHHRDATERRDGLGGAVVVGLRLAACEWCVVMDGDLQHPPELVPQLVEKGAHDGSDLVVASRYDGHGDAASFSRGRAAMSTWATRVTKAFFPRLLKGVSDPMSGFFAVRRDSIDLEALRPSGFKILLEIAVRCAPLRISEVSFEFGRRFAGQSKAGLGEVIRLFLVMARLWVDTSTANRLSRMVAFGLVGGSGLVVNTLALYVATGVLGRHYLVGTILATFFSTTWNWFLLEVLVYPGGDARTAMRRYLSFGAVNVLALALRLPLIAMLVESIRANYLLANLASLVVLFALRFVASDMIIYRRPPTKKSPTTDAATSDLAVVDLPAVDFATSDLAVVDLPAVDVATSDLAVVELPGEDVVASDPRPAAMPAPADGDGGYLRYRYLVPGVATIGSEAPLPELEWFLTPFLTRGPFDIEIRVARVGKMRGRVRLTADGDTERVYEEHLGGLGANFRIEMGETIRITAGPLLDRSPHVLYTNVVEALLRFLAVSKGRVLLHSACVQMGGTGVLLSARTDTGKTGTILRLIRNEGARFLSDDMTIVEPNGRAHSFPKPLTISNHTLLAVDSRGLSKREWYKLRLQSRLHSREGRQFGMWLANMNLPIMTFNAVTQAIVPPPKYDVDRLVPCDVIHEVDVTDLFIIERGENGIEEVPQDQALDELIENTDDAYGFPPFSSLAPTLRVGGMDYATLRARERELLGQALARIRVRRLVRDDFGWPSEITSVLDSREVEEPSVRADADTGRPPLADRVWAPSPRFADGPTYAGGTPA